MGKLRLFGELSEAGGVAQEGGSGGGHQIARVVRTAGDYQTTSTSFVDIDPSNLSISLTTGASWVQLLLAGSIYVSSYQYGLVDFTIDGERQGQAKGVQQIQPSYTQDIQIAWLTQVSAGTHVFRPQWRVGGGTATLYASSAQSPLFFAVIEMK